MHLPWVHLAFGNVNACPLDSPMPQEPFKSWWNPALVSCTWIGVWSTWMTLLSSVEHQKEHLHWLKAVISKLRAAGLKLKPTKCDLFRQQIGYLGHVSSKEGVSTDPDKIKAVTKWPQPTTVTEVRSFLGFVSYYRRFITNFSKVAKPLNKLLQNLEGTPSQKKRFKVCWGLEQQEAFETLERLCTESPTLAYADFKAPFVLHTNASRDPLGAVLYQVQDGQRRVTAYASRSLSKSERNYPVHQLEFLALKWAATDKFHEYLYGSEF